MINLILSFLFGFWWCLVAWALFELDMTCRKVGNFMLNIALGGTVFFITYLIMQGLIKVGIL